MASKLRSRISVLGTRHAPLARVLPSSALPRELGGLMVIEGDVNDCSID